MLSVTQIAAVIRSEMRIPEDKYPGADLAAEKIYDLCKPAHDIHLAAAALENEVTSTLMDMLVATILATLIEQEGGGRTNITFSPGAMQEIMTNWVYSVETAGMDRTIRIAPKKGDEWSEGEPPSKLESLLMADSDKGEAKPQAAVHEYDRPLWVVACTDEDGNTIFSRQLDRASAERELRSWGPQTALERNARIENRHCLHPTCPTTGCNEVTSEEG